MNVADIARELKRTGMRGEFHIPGSSRQLPPDREFHAKHIKIELRVDLERKQISGAVTTTFVPLREGLQAIHLDACEMRVAGVTLDGRPAEYEHDGRVLTIYTPSLGADRAKAHELRVEYSARPRQGVYFIGPDASYPDKPLQAWTQGEPEFSRYWFPCYDHPNDKATSETLITVPRGYLVVSNGRLVSELRAEPTADEEEASKVRRGGGGGGGGDSSGSGQSWVTFHWREDVPHSSYLTSFVVGKFAMTEEVSAGVPLQYYFPESKRADAPRLYGLTPDMLSVFESLTQMKYPFEKYSQVAVQDFIIGGMENVSATTLTDTRFPDARSEEDYASRYSKPDRNHIELVAHELAHMWFGDLVTAKHWSHLWLNEGFATYFQALYTERKYGKDDFRHDMLSKAEAYFQLDGSLYRRAIVDDTYVYPDDIFDSCAYEKASWMIHQLRYILGDRLFFETIAEYLRRHARATVDTHDLLRVSEDVSGLSLEGYFEQSFYRAGHPEFDVTFSWDEATKTASVLVRQTQTLDELTPVFSLPCELAFYVGTQRIAKKVRLGVQEERFHFELPGKPDIVEFDPEEWLLKKVKFAKPLSMLLPQLERSRDASSRRRAAEALASFKDDETVVSALEATALKDGEHHSVRSEAARSLGKIGSEQALDSLLRLVKVKQRRVRRSVIAALGEFRDGRVEEPILTAMRSDESPYVQCQAALSYGKASLPDAYSVLTSMVGTPSPEDAMSEACLEALGYNRGRVARTKQDGERKEGGEKEEGVGTGEEERSRTRAFLRSYLPYGRPIRARVGALKGLSKLGWLEQVDVALLKEILLKDRQYTIRLEVLETVSELLDRRFLEAVREAAEKDSDPRVRRRAMEVELRLADTTSTIEKTLSDVKDEVERVKLDNRDLRESISGMKLS
jgi:aminopeptidase N